MAQVPFPAPGPGGDEPPLPGAAARDKMPGGAAPDKMPGAARGKMPRDEGGAGEGASSDGMARGERSADGPARGAGQPGGGIPRAADDAARDAGVPPAAGGVGDDAADDDDDDADSFDADADLARLLDDIEAGLIPIPPEDDPGPPVMFALGETADLDPVELAAMAGPDGLGGQAFAQGRAADAMRPGPLLAVLTEQAAGDPAGLGDDELLGMVSAARRLANRAQYLELAGIAEFTRRRAAQYAASVAGKARPGRRDGEFADDELGMELVMNRRAAGDRMDLAHELAARLPRTFSALAAGLIGADRAAVIWSCTRFLSDADAAYADEVLAAAAPGLRYEQLSARAHRLEIKLDPEGVARRKEEARQRGRRVETRRELSGNMSFGGRELSAEEALAAKAFNDGDAAALRAAGMPGTLGALRVLAMLDRTRGLNPFDRLTHPDTDDGDAGNGDGYRDGESDGDGECDRGGGNRDDCDDESDRDDNSDRDGSGDEGYREDDGYREDGEDGRGSGGGGESGDDGPGGPGGGPGGPGGSRGPGGPGGPGGAPGGAPAPVPALINLAVPAGDPARLVHRRRRQPSSLRAARPRPTPAPSSTPHHNTPEPAGASPSPAPTAPPSHTAAPAASTPGPPHSETARPPTAPRHQDHHHHRGRQDHPGPTRTRQRNSPRSCAPSTPPSPPSPAAAATHSQRENRYTPSRALQHLIRARTARCIAPGCTTHAANCDLDHTIAYPDGPTDQCNLAPPCRHHHRVKQAPGWHLEQPQPGLMHWTTPAGRTYTTTPTIYDT